MALNLQILGKGWKFPFGFAEDKGGVATTEGLDHIRESLTQIIGTALGERFFLRSFGSRISDIQFDPIDISLGMELEHNIREAAESWEPRVELLEVSVDTNYPSARLGRVDIFIQFVVIQDNVVDNLVYPFYLSPDAQARIEGVTG